MRWVRNTNWQLTCFCPRSFLTFEFASLSNLNSYAFCSAVNFIRSFISSCVDAMKSNLSSFSWSFSAEHFSAFSSAKCRILCTQKSFSDSSLRRFVKSKIRTQLSIYRSSWSLVSVKDASNSWFFSKSALTSFSSVFCLPHSFSYRRIVCSSFSSWKSNKSFNNNQSNFNSNCGFCGKLLRRSCQQVA